MRRRFLRPLLVIAALLVIVAVQQPAYAPPTGITVQDEGITKGTGVTTLNFVGPNFAATVAGSVGTITHLDSPGGGSDPTPETELDPRDFGGQPGACDATKAAANDSAWTQMLAALAVPPPGTTEPGGTIDLGRFVWCFNHTVFVQNKVKVHGDGRNTKIAALAGFNDTTVVQQSGQPVNVLVELGNGNGDRNSFAFGSRVEGVNIDANGVAGLVPVFSQQANEQSGLREVLVNDFVGTGIWMATGTSIISLGPHLEVYGNSGACTSGCLRLESWGQNVLYGELTTSTATTPTLAGTSGVWFNGVDGTVWSGIGIHAEQVETGVKVGPNADVTLQSLQGHDTVTNMATYDATSSGTVANVLKGCCSGGSAFTLKDSTPGGKNFTGRVITYEVNPSRQVVSGSRTGKDPIALSLLDAMAARGEVNDQTTP